MRRDATQVLAMCAWVKKQIGKVEDQAKAIADVSIPDEKAAGLVGDTVVSYTSRIARQPELAITDSDMFTAWVAEHYPTELVQAVRPSFMTVLRDNARIAGAVLGPGGEVCEYAELADPVIYTITRLTKDADRALGPVLGGVSLAELPNFIEESQA